MYLRAQMELGGLLGTNNSEKIYRKHFQASGSVKKSARAANQPCSFFFTIMKWDPCISATHLLTWSDMFLKSTYRELFKEYNFVGAMSPLGKVTRANSW